MYSHLTEIMKKSCHWRSSKEWNNTWVMLFQIRK